MKENKESKRMRFGRFSYLILAIIFLACVLMQIFTAGLAIFVNPENWVKHFSLVHLFGFNIPVLMLVMAILGKMPKWAFWQLFGLLAAIFAMYFTANITSALPLAGAVHPVIAVILFMLSYSNVFKTWKLISRRAKEEKKVEDSK